MKDKISNFFRKEIEKESLLKIMIAILILAVLPLLIVAFFDHPCADDFTYGFYTHAFWSTTHSIKQTLFWAFHTVKTTYDTWQGTFTSAFLMSLSPAIFGEGFYWITAYIMLGMIIGSTFFIMKVLLVDLLKADKVSYGIITVITVFMIVEQFHWPSHGIFWYNAAVHYTFMHSCMLFMLGCAIHIIQAEKRKKLVLSIILSSVFAFTCSGSNYVTALTGILLCAFVMFCGFLAKKKQTLWILIPFITYVIGFYFNVTAYGNTIRQAYFEKQTPYEAIMNSLINCVRRGQDWFTILFFIIVIILVPVSWNMVQKMNYKFHVPGLVTLLSFLVTAEMFTPSYYAINSEGVARTINIIKMTFQVLFILNEVYWLGWFSTKLKAKKIQFEIPHFGTFYAVMAIIILLVFQTSTNKEGEYITYAAYYAIGTGQVMEYHQEYMNRLAILEGDSKYLTLAPFENQPFLLWVDDIVTNDKDWRNAAMAAWYQKDSIALEE